MSKKTIKYGSVCSGIEAATVAWHDLGWKPAFFSDIEPFPRAVLNHHYSDIPCHGDFTTIKGDDYGSIDLLVGGTPCQAFSVAGLRKGFADDRGNLTLEYIRLAQRTKPRWLVWENVPGVLSIDGGRAFGAFLGGLAECGYGFAYRVLDAQYFGVPQRRRRVFVVGYLGDWRPAAAVLFERESLCGDITPCREQREKTAAFTSSSFGGYSEGCGTLRSNGGDLGAGSETLLTYDRQSSGEYGSANIASTMSARDYKSPSDLISYGISGNWIGRKPENGGNAVEPMYDVSPCLTKADRHGVAQPVYEVHGQDSRVTELGDTCSTLTKKYGTGGGNIPITFSFDSLSSNSMKSSNPHSGCNEVDIAKTLDTTRPDPSKNQGGNGILHGHAVRRLTPTECERLQGFPDGYTNIPWNGKQYSPDGLRYQALGNSMAVPVMNWIGKRIQIIEDEICKK